MIVQVKEPDRPNIESVVQSRLDDITQWEQDKISYLGSVIERQKIDKQKNDWFFELIINLNESGKCKCPLTFTSLSQLLFSQPKED